MPKKIRILIIFLLIAAGLHLSAQPVSLEDAQNVAKNWMFQKTGKYFSIQNGSVATKNGDISGDHAQVRIIRLDPKAWVIVSADDVAQPILGYGESPIDLSNQPPGFKDWISDADQQIEAGVNSGSAVASSSQSIIIKNKIDNEWKRLKVDPKIFAEQKKPVASEVGAVAIAPLLWMGTGSESGGIIWGQGAGYNAYCPYDSSSQYNNHTLVGCAATAMGQIMRYYQLPTRGTGSHSYDALGYGTQSADFGATSYNWGSMPYQLGSSSSSAQIDAVAMLLYHTGVSVDMGYGIDISSAYPTNVPPALKNYFGYTESDLYNRAASSNWDSWLQTELGAKRPLFYAGYGSGGHAFVLDGYDGSGYYHFNWGWDGLQNGYYSLSNLTPADYSFTNDQLAVKIVSSSTPPPPPPPPPGKVTRTDVTELYVATFLRAPDSGGLNYWVNDSGLSIEGIAQSFFDQPETQAEYPPGTTIGEFVEAVYYNLFNRYPDQAGFDYWVDEIYYGRITPGLFILAVINGAQGSDATILNNKTRVGEHYANSGLNDPWCAQYVMYNIDESEQSVQDAFAYINNGCK